jgi:hypothetical protein
MDSISHKPFSRHSANNFSPGLYHLSTLSDCRQSTINYMDANRYLLASLDWGECRQIADFGRAGVRLHFSTLWRYRKGIYPVLTSLTEGYFARYWACTRNDLQTLGDDLAAGRAVDVSGYSLPDMAELVANLPPLPEK